LAFVLRTSLSVAALLDHFRALFPPEALWWWLGGKVLYGRAFTPLIVLWYLVFQFLSGDRTLAAVVEDARDGGADRLSPKGKRLSRQLRSDATASWAEARQRLPVATVHHALRASGQSIRARVHGRQWHGLDLVPLDGSTFRLRPWGDIPQAFPPHGGGNTAQPYWCLVRVVVAFCLATGVVLDCTLGAMTCSEQALALEMLVNRVWAGALFIADRNFGVYAVVRAAVFAQAQILVRLTQVRAQKLARHAGLTLQAGLDQRVSWIPTRHDQCSPGLSRTPVHGRLIAMPMTPRGFRPFVLYLFTTLVDAEFTVADLVQGYGMRWQVELDLRYVKTQLDLEVLECKSADLARKLWLAGLLAYNVVRAVMSAAAAVYHQSVFALSFTRSLKALRKWLPKAGSPQALRSWRRLLRRVAGFRHPQRKKLRPSEPRAIRYFKRDFPKLSGDRAKAREKLMRANADS